VNGEGSFRTRRTGRKGKTTQGKGRENRGKKRCLWGVGEGEGGEGKGKVEEEVWR